MIAVFLDRDYKEIVSINERSIVEASRGRFIEGRVVKDSLTIIVDLGVYNKVKGSSYIVVSSDSRLRTQPVYRIVDTEIGRNYRIEASGAGVEELKYKRIKEIDTSLYEKDSKRVAGVVSATIENGWLYSFGEGIKSKTSLDTVGGGTVYEALEELADDIDVDIEFDYLFDRGEKVVNKVVRFKKELGKDITSGIVYGVNATSFKMKEYRDEVLTSVVAYGKEDENGKVLDLSTLRGKRYELNNGRYAVVKETPEGEFGLEEPDLTNEFGIYNVQTKKVEPKVGEVRISGEEDVNLLVNEAKRKLENSLPEVEITINGSNIQADVGDKLPVYHGQLNIDVKLDIISIDENMLVEDDIRYQIGVRKKSEYDKKFDNIEVIEVVKEEEGNEIPEVSRVIISPRTVTYEGYDSWDTDTARWITNPRYEIGPDNFDYYLEFDYVINDGNYTAEEFILGMTYFSTAVWNRRSQQYPEFPSGIKYEIMMTKSLSGNRGRVKVRLNDYADFMLFKSKDNVRTRNYSNGVFLEANNFIAPFLIVKNEKGERYSLNHLDYSKGNVGINELTGYITNYQITQH